MATTSGMIEVIANDRLGTRVRVKCSKDDTVGDLKKAIAAQTGTRFEKIRLKRANREYKNHITLSDYEINDGQVHLIAIKTGAVQCSRLIGCFLSLQITGRALTSTSPPPDGSV
ncbi:hypothetical protein PSHT_00299 [Puccinia striiformis]|uniref:Ubiquitin-like modifier HUB1 n=1 Tax=Puccinia striiformis TaxID=27350 RepID=A0A2S4WNQ5_9BASI|nr:hypothetical protein PSHT_00299 [Puccinia striiformis]